MRKILLVAILCTAAICNGDDQENNLPYPSITDQYSSLISSYFDTNSGFGYEYPFLAMNNNIGSFLVLSGALSAQKKQDNPSDFNPNVNYTTTYYLSEGNQQTNITDSQRADDKLKGIPLFKPYQN